MIDSAAQNYFEQVLGVRNLLMPDAVVPAPSPSPSPSDWQDRIWIDGSVESAEIAFIAAVSPSNARQAESEIELLRKMAQATKANAKQMLLLVIPEAEIPEVLREFNFSKFKNIFWLGEGLLDTHGLAIGELKSVSGVHWLGTHGLEDLHRQPELKKSAWTHMKKLIAKW